MGAVVGEDTGNAASIAMFEQVHHRQVHLRDLPAQLHVFDPGDNPVAVPRFEPARRPVAQTAFRLVDFPGSMGWT